jgi:nucleoside-diphosphate-sugar epimerase
MSSSVTRVLFAGATGALGRATLPHLEGHDVVGLTKREIGSSSFEHSVPTAWSVMCTTTKNCSASRRRRSLRS